MVRGFLTILFLLIFIIWFIASIRLLAYAWDFSVPANHSENKVTKWLTGYEPRAPRENGAYRHNNASDQKPHLKKKTQCSIAVLKKYS